MSLFLGMGFAPDVSACSGAPETDGYHADRNGLPWHVHPEATPDEWAALAEAIASGDVAIAAWAPPVVSPADALAELRAARNALLAGCDWTQIPDCPLTPELRTRWAEYRQALRDLPETFADAPASAAFPTAPDEGD